MFIVFQLSSSECVTHPVLFFLRLALSLSVSLTPGAAPPLRASVILTLDIYLRQESLSDH